MDAKDKIAYELDKEEREQLHEVVLSFSKQSLDLKRLLATVLVATVTIGGGLFREDLHLFFEYRRFILLGILFVIVLFWLMDAMTNFYANRLRGQMIENLNRNLEKQELPIKNNPWNPAEKQSLKVRIKWSKCLKFGSHFMFYYFLAVPTVLLIIEAWVDLLS